MGMSASLDRVSQALNRRVKTVVCAMGMTMALGIDLIQLGVIVVANLAIGMLTPPMGICLIVSASISGDRISAVSRRVMPVLIVLLVDLALICFYPPLTLWLSSLVGGN